MTDLSIVIVSYNTCEVTRRCLESITRQTEGVEYEIIVVDNASADGSVAMIEKEFPLVRLIRNHENRGFAAAQNAGLRQARGRHLLILNSDVFFIENAAKLMLTYLKNGPVDLGVVGPQILNPDGTVAPSARRTYYSKPMIGLAIVNRHFSIKRFLPPETFLRNHFGFILARLHDNYDSFKTPKQVEYIDAMCMLVKRDVLEQVGLFDEQFFFDFEITDLSIRIRQRDWKIAFFPGAQVIHLSGSSRKKFSGIVVETHRSELIYYAKHDPTKVTFVKRAAMLIVSLKKLWVKVCLILGSHDNSRQESFLLYKEIVKICRQFNPHLVWVNERIPFLSPRQPAGQRPKDKSFGKF